MKAARALFWKEVRENAKWAAMGAFAFAVGLVYTVYHSFNPNSDSSASGLVLTTLWDQTNMAVALGVPAIGAALGLLQILPERNRDRWAFLVHRPVDRFALFAGKAAAGIVLFLAASIIPFVIANPFDVRVALSDTSWPTAIRFFIASSICRGMICCYLRYERQTSGRIRGAASVGASVGRGRLYKYKSRASRPFGRCPAGANVSSSRRLADACSRDILVTSDVDGVHYRWFDVCLDYLAHRQALRLWARVDLGVGGRERLLVLGRRDRYDCATAAPG